MKSLTLLILVFLVSAPSFANATLKSIEDCNIDLRKTNLNQSRFVIEGTRVEGKAALDRISLLQKKEVETVTTVDELGVKRYKTLTLKTLLETDGGSVNSCSGEVLVSRLDICTQDAYKVVCEVRCDVRWIGRDCR